MHEQCVKRMKIGVILSGCGNYDGSGIHEAVFCLLMLERLGVDYQCFAPDIYAEIYNPITREKLSEKRNLLIESARIARGNIYSLSQFQMERFDGLVIPGNYTMNYNPPDGVAQVIRAVAEAGKPIAATSTAVIWVAEALQAVEIQPKITLGHLAAYPSEHPIINWALQASAKGIIIAQTDADDFLEDDLNNIITTAGYLANQSIVQVFQAIEKTITKLVEMVTLVMSS